MARSSTRDSAGMGRTYSVRNGCDRRSWKAAKYSLELGWRNWEQKPSKMFGKRKTYLDLINESSKMPNSLLSPWKRSVGWLNEDIRGRSPRGSTWGWRSSVRVYYYIRTRKLMFVWRGVHYSCGRYNGFIYEFVVLLVQKGIWFYAILLSPSLQYSRSERNVCSINNPSWYNLNTFEAILMQ